MADVNDNMPQFGAERYSKSLLVKDAKKGDLVLRLTATDHDAGNNSLITYRSVGCWHHNKWQYWGFPRTHTPKNINHKKELGRIRADASCVSQHIA